MESRYWWYQFRASCWRFHNIITQVQVWCWAIIFCSNRSCRGVSPRGDFEIPRFGKRPLATTDTPLYLYICLRIHASKPLVSTNEPRNPWRVNLVNHVPDASDESIRIHPRLPRQSRFSSSILPSRPRDSRIEPIFLIDSSIVWIIASFLQGKRSRNCKSLI